MARRSFPGAIRSAFALCLLAFVLCLSSASAQVRIKDVTDLEGVRPNQLYGFGLVTGLAGTGSRCLFTQQVVVDMLQRQGVSGRIFNQTPADPVLRSTSVASVMVTAEIGPFNRCGSRIDVTVNAIDDTSSLQGGTLILTPLRGSDGVVYAVAQGPLTIGGFIVGGAATTIQKNHPNVGRVVGGGLVEKEALGEAVCKGKSRFLLKNPDPDTARRIVRAFNDHCPECALAQDAGTVAVCLPKLAMTNPVGFLSELGQLEIRPDTTARVVVNERTGTVVVGADVKLATTAVSHGNLTILVAETPEVSQPNPFGRGVTAVVPRTTVDVNESKPQLNLVPGVPRNATVADLARALNALGVSPRDLISIFQALKQAGALYAELEVI